MVVSCQLWIRLLTRAQPERFREAALTYIVDLQLLIDTLASFSTTDAFQQLAGDIGALLVLYKCASGIDDFQPRSSTEVKSAIAVLGEARRKSLKGTSGTTPMGQALMEAGDVFMAHSAKDDMADGFVSNIFYVHHRQAMHVRHNGGQVCSFPQR